MGTPATASVNVGTRETSKFDAIIIGAGVSGLYQLYKLIELGLQLRVFEAGSGVGGAWYWNRYPGARFDSDSHTYGYSFFAGAARRVGLERALCRATRDRTLSQLRR